MIGWISWMNRLALSHPSTCFKSRLNVNFCALDLVAFGNEMDIISKSNAQTLKCGDRAHPLDKMMGVMIDQLI